MRQQLDQRAPRKQTINPPYQINAAGVASVRCSASQAAWFPPDSGRIQSGILFYLGGPERSREGGVSGCFWSSAESKAGRLKPNLVMLQPPAPPAPRPPSARHVTAQERQENAEGLRWKSQRQVPNRPWSEDHRANGAGQNVISLCPQVTVTRKRLMVASLHPKHKCHAQLWTLKKKKKKSWLWPLKAESIQHLNQ